MRLANVTIPGLFLGEAAGADPDALVRCDVALRGGRIQAVTPAAGACTHSEGEGERAATENVCDGNGGLLVPAFVDAHTHLDKGHVWPRTANPDGTFAGALQATRHDRQAHWTADDVRRRMDFSLRAAYAHGTSAIRTHIDSHPPQEATSWPVFVEMRHAWAGRIDLQGVSLMGIDEVPDDPAPLFDRIAGYGGLVGAALFPLLQMRRKVAAMLAAAEDRGMDIDFHVDETLAPDCNALAVVAEEAARIGFSGTITCGHCCSLMTMAEAEAWRTLDAAARANIAFVSLPLCNLYLQDRRQGRTPRVRGGTLVHEMRARGLRVAIASDNTRDPFYAYGDLDMAEVWREATRVLHLDHPVADWPAAFSAVPASIMGLDTPRQVAAGAPADLVLFRARTFTELFARPQSDRVVLRAGAPIAAAVPDYSELDDLWTLPR